MTRGRLLALLMLFLLVSSGCRPANRIVIGSKNFTEQIILAELLAQCVESRTSLRVERRMNLGGTLIAHQALLGGEIDSYPEYTGTALTAILGEAPSESKENVLKRVKARYASRFGLEVLDPFGFNNSFAMVIRGNDARRLKLSKISDIQPYAPKWRAGFGYEFMERPDGFHGLVKKYDLHFEIPPRTLDLGLLYRALVENQVDVVAGNSTDGVIPVLDLVVLQDDKHYFLPYEAVPIVRQDTLSKHPELRAALNSLAERISETEMRELNYAVDGQHKDPREVARDFLRAKGGI